MTAAGERYPVIVVDDDEDFRTMVSQLLGRVGYETRGVATGEQALAAARSERPALVLLDVHLPDVSGYEVYRALRAELGQDVPIIFLSGARTESYDRVGGLMLGADDYIVKPFVTDELIARVRGMIARTRHPAPRRDHGLTNQELRILKCLAEGLTQGEIARRLFISPKTVATHIQHILGKLGVHSRAQAVAFAYQRGLLEDG